MIYKTEMFFFLVMVHGLSRKIRMNVLGRVYAPIY